MSARAESAPRKICLSYRRSDSMAITGRIFDRLAAHFGSDAIFIDIDDIPFGVNFRHHIDNTLRQSDVLVAIVGPQWLGPAATRGDRIREAADPVRIEIQTALEQRLQIIPVLIDGAVMPAELELPDSLREFAYLQAVDVSSARDFNIHIDRLIRAIDARLGNGNAEHGALSCSQEPDRVAAASLGFRSAASLALLAVFAVLVLHYLIVIKLDLSDIYLRTSVFAVSGMFGYLIYPRLRKSGALVLLFGAAVSLASVIGMLATVGVIEGTSIMPATVFEWQEATEVLCDYGNCSGPWRRYG